MKLETQIRRVWPRLCLTIGWAFLALLTNISLTAAPGTKIWEFQADSAVNCTPAIGEDGTLYIGAASGRVYAVNRETGAERWNFLTGGAANSPVVGNNDLIYVSSTDGNLYALNAWTGKKQWSFAAGAGITVPAIDENGVVYVGSGSAKLYALNGLTGSNIWTYATAYPVNGAPVIGADGAVYIGAAGYLHSVDRVTGTNRWVYYESYATMQAQGPPWGTVQITNDLAKCFISSPALNSDGTLFSFLGVRIPYDSYSQGINTMLKVAIDAATGQKKWLTSLDTQDSVSLDTTPTMGSDGVVYLGFSYLSYPISIYGGVFYALDANTGTNKWAIAVGSGRFSRYYPFMWGMHSSPAIGADGTAYLASTPDGGGLFQAVDPNTGTNLWTFPLGGWAYSSPAIGADGTIYIGSESGKLYALAGNTNQGLARSSWPKSFGSARNSGASPSVAGENYVIERLAQPAAVSTWAGSGQSSFQDGTGTNAAFNNPGGCWVTAEGIIYIAETDNHRIRRVSTDGTVTTLAGTGVAGHLDGPAASAQFSGPVGICSDAQGNLWVAETNNYIRKIDASGHVTTVAGTGVSGYVDGLGSIAQFNSPHGLVTDGTNNVWVTDSNNHAVRKIAADGTVSTWAGNGTAGDVDGARDVAFLNQPSGIARDSTGILYVSERGGNRIRRIAVDGHVDTLAGSGVAGYIDGPAGQARFNQPDGLVLDAQNNLWVADVQNQAVRRIDPQGRVQTAAGTLQAGYVDGSGKSARFSGPRGLGMDGQGIIYVLDTGNERVRKITLSPDLSLAAIPDQTVDVLQTLTLNIPLANTNAYGSVQFILAMGPDGMRIDGQTGVLTWTPTLLQGRTTNQINVRVTDSNGVGDTKTFSIITTWPKNVPGGELWEFTAGGAISGCPAIDDEGTVYFGSADKNVYAVNGITGQKIWSFTTGGAVNSAPAYSTLGLVYIGSDDGTLYAIDAKSGEEKWHFSTSQPVRSTPAIGTDRTIYFTADALILGLDGYSGLSKWEYHVDGSHASSPVIGSDGKLYVNVSWSPLNIEVKSAAIYALKPSKGYLQWISPINVFFGSSGLAIGNNGFVWSGPGSLCGTDLKKGTTNISWGPSIDEGISTSDPYYTTEHWDRIYSVYSWLNSRQWHLSPAIGADGTIYCAMLNKSLWAMDGLSGTRKWSFAAGDFIASAPTVGNDGAVYAGTMAGNIYALDGNSGTNLWQFPAGGTPSPVAIGTSGTLYVGSANGKLYAISGNSNNGGLANSSWPKLLGNARNTGAVSPITFQRIAKDATGAIQLHCGVGAGITFQLQYKSGIDDPQWQNVGGTITSTNESVTFSDSMSTNSQRFYRVIQMNN